MSPLSQVLQVEHGEPATRLLKIVDGQVDCLVESRAGKMVQFADSVVFSHKKQVLVSAAQRLSGDVALEECRLTAWKQQQLLKSKMRKVLLDSKSPGAKEAPTLERSKTLSLEQAKPRSLEPAHSHLVLDARSWRVVGNTPGWFG